jgi:hypothetical protein
MAVGIGDAGDVNIQMRRPRRPRVKADQEKRGAKYGDAGAIMDTSL